VARLRKPELLLPSLAVNAFGPIRALVGLCFRFMDVFPMLSSASAPVRASSSSRFYAAAWRWHFYAGLFVVPFLTILAVTGLVMVYFTGFQSRLGNLVHVQPQNTIQAVTVQAKAVLAQFPDAKLQEYIAPKTSDLAAWFVVARGGVTEAVAVDPYSAKVIRAVDKESTGFAWARKIHASLLLGDTGKRVMEVAAGLGIVMIVTGLYLFWPRNGGRWAQALVPEWRATGRRWWKSLHASIGFWISVVLFSFLLTGMSWTEVWGGKFVQPWGTFPAAKWDAVPTSDLTHASLDRKSVV